MPKCPGPVLDSTGIEYCPRTGEDIEDDETCEKCREEGV